MDNADIEPFHSANQGYGEKPSKGGKGKIQPTTYSLLPTVAVIGAGLGGLSAAIHLRLVGYDVTVFEANERVGGRANLIERDGFRFDTGPSLITMPWVFADLFQAAGARLEDVLELEQLHPIAAYRFADGTRFDYSASMPEWLDTVRRLESRDVDGFLKFMELGARLYEVSKETFLRRRPTERPDARSLRALRFMPLRYGWGNYHRTVAAWAAPVFLLLAGFITLMGASGREIAALVLAAIIGLAAEVVGAQTGLIFSSYSYTEALEPRLLGVPIVMASAWMVLVGYVREMLARLALPASAEIVIAAAWMTAIDLLIDPLAAGALGYWRWLAPGAYYGIPARNFVGWFIVSLLILALVRGFIERGRRENPAARPIGVSIILFFTLIALAHRLTLAVVAGVSLCIAHLALSFYRRARALRASRH